MIPKIIHYCWFGGKPLPEPVKKCIATWEKYCPDYQIIRWDESNYNVFKNSYTKAAYENKKWAFLSDYVRLDVVYTSGGIYLDTDVELLRSPEELRQNTCFMGMEEVGTVNTGLGFGAEAGHPFLLRNMRAYEESDFVREDGGFRPEICVLITTRLLGEDGLLCENQLQKIAGVTVYPVEVLCPQDHKTGKLTLTDRTVSIHHYAEGWHTGTERIYAAIRRKFAGKGKIGQAFGRILSAPFSLLNTIRREGFRPAMRHYLKKLRR